MRLTGGIYQFKCSDASCSQNPFDEFTFDSDLQKITCPTCNKPVIRVIPESHNAEAPDLLSEAVGLHPSQIAEARQKFPHHRFHEDGRMIFSSQREKDKVLKDLGYVDHKD